MVIDRRQLSGCLIFASVIIVLFFAACGGGGKAGIEPPPVLPITISITPTTANLSVNGTQSFTATVNNTTNTAVTWTVQEANGGSIDTAGKYTAPAVAGTYHVIAKSQADSAKTATATITVTAPAPTISSTAPTQANEGDLYQYTISATDPANGTLTYVLTNGPTGAALSTNVLSWTPTASQSRVSNNFTVTVKTSGGSQATQSWTVAPTGIVRGVVKQINVGVHGRVSTPVDLSGVAVAAVVPSGSGEPTVLYGTGSADGTFEIAGVPAGYYGLMEVESGISANAARIGATAVAGSVGNLLWTDKSFIDLSSIQAGRIATAATGEIQRNYNITGLNPWQDFDSLRWSMPNIDDYQYWDGYALDSTEANAVAYSTWLADASAGDIGFMNQFQSATLSGAVYKHIVKTSGPITFSDVDSQATAVDAAMHDPTATISMRAKFKVSDFDTLIRQKHPNSLRSWSWFGAYIHPFDLSQGFVTWGDDLFRFEDDLVASQQPGATRKATQTATARGSLLNAISDAAGDIDLGDLTVANPFPSEWTPIYEYDEQHELPITAPGATTSDTIPLFIYQLTKDKPSAELPVTPLLGVVNSGTVDGKDLFADQTDVSLSPKLTWQAPSVGSANGYLVQLLEVANNAGSTEFYYKGLMRTTATSIQVPPGLIEPGKTYIVLITAVQETGIDLSNTPLLTGFPRAQSGTASGLLTTIAVPSTSMGSGIKTSALETVLSRLKSNSGKPSVWSQRVSQRRAAAKAAAGVK